MTLTNLSIRWYDDPVYSFPIISIKSFKSVSEKSVYPNAMVSLKNRDNKQNA